MNQYIGSNGRGFFFFIPFDFLENIYVMGEQTIF